MQTETAFGVNANDALRLLLPRQISAGSFKILHKFAIDQHVDEIEYLHLRGVGFIELVAGHADIFPQAFCADALLPSAEDIRYVCGCSGSPPTAKS